MLHARIADYLDRFKIQSEIFMLLHGSMYRPRTNVTSSDVGTKE